MRLALPHELSDSVDWTQPINWSHPLNRGLVGWWLAVPGAMGYGSTTWRDLTGKRTPGVLTNMDSKTDWGGANGRLGGWGYLDFDGTNDYVNIESAFFSAATRSTTAWFRSRTTAAGIRFVLTMGSGTPNRWYLGTSGSNFLYRVGTQGSDNTVGTFVANQDYHVALTFDGSTARLYVNGVLTSATAATLSGSAGGTIGAYNDSVANVFDGSIDDVRMFDRALSASDVASLYGDSLAFNRLTLNRISLPFYAPEEAGGGIYKRSPFVSPIFNSPVIRGVA